MHDADSIAKKPMDDTIVLANVGDAYWLLEGERHLTALLTQDAPYPTPVCTARFPDNVTLDAFLQGQDTQLSSLWSVHPNIINRLKHDEELTVLNPPSAV
jgi:hypothetical protein